MYCKFHLKSKVIIQDCNGNASKLYLSLLISGFTGAIDSRFFGTISYPLDHTIN